MKKLISLLLTLIFLISLTPQIFATSSGSSTTKPIKVYIDSKEQKLTLPVITKDSRTLYPLRELAGLLGAEAAWDGSINKVTLTKGSNSVSFVTGKQEYTVNGTNKSMDTKAIIEKSTNLMYIPVRYLAEALGYDVQWIECQKCNIAYIDNLGEYKLMSDEEFVDKYYNYEHTSNFYYDPDIANHRLLFKNDYISKPFKNYSLDTKVNPDINRQIFDVMKALSTDGEYAYAEYCNDDRHLVLLKFSRDYAKVLNYVNYFEYIFYEKEPFDMRKSWGVNSFSNKVVFELRLNGLWWDYIKDGIITDLYAKKFRNSLITLLGNKYGINIYNFALKEYLKDKNADIGTYWGVKKVENFGNIQVDYCRDNDAILRFYFSYIN